MNNYLLLKEMAHHRTEELSREATEHRLVQKSPPFKLQIFFNSLFTSSAPKEPITNQCTLTNTCSS